MLPLWIIGIVVAIIVYLNLSPKPKEVRGKVVLITGGASGIGLGMARKFAELGSKVVVWDINPTGLQAVESEFKAKNYDIHTYVCDVSARKNIYQVAEQVKADVGKVDILINNAGIVVGKPFVDTTDEQTEKIMQVNAMAPMWATKFFLPDMLKSSGHVVTIASAAGHTGMPLLADYCASKHAACGFMDSLRMELLHLKQYHVKCTTVMPFYIATGMFEGVKGAILFPILSPEYVVSRIMKGILTNEAEIHIPATTKLRFIMRLLPIGFTDFLGETLGLSKSMDQFKGRTNQK